VARVVRGQVISVKEMQYVTAARALGFGIRIILIISHLTSWRQLLLFRLLTRISYISGKRFKLQLGTTPYTQLGSIIKDHYSYIILGKPYLAMVPGVAIMLLTLAYDDGKCVKGC
jgi:peptide/nickel transport system permease protein